MGTIPRSFFARPAHEVAPELLGMILVRSLPDGQRLTGRIVETEAYEPDDPACHGYRGATRRNATIFGPPGRLYVYFTYGNHWMANVVTRDAGEGSAVLLRAVEPLEGLDEMRRRREREPAIDLCSGPGKLCRALAIDHRLDGADLLRHPAIRLRRGNPIEPDAITTGCRVGISVGLDRPWRFLVTADRFVSRGRPGPPTPRRRAAPSTR